MRKKNTKCNQCWDYGWMCNGACLDPENHDQRSDCKEPLDCDCLAGTGKRPLCEEVRVSFVEVSIAKTDFARLLSEFCGKGGKAYTKEERKLLDAFGKLEYGLLSLSGAALRLVKIDEDLRSPSQTKPA